MWAVEELEGYQKLRELTQIYKYHTPDFQYRETGFLEETRFLCTPLIWRLTGSFL